MVVVVSGPVVVDVVLAGTSSLSGAVSSAGRGTPIPDARVTLFDHAGNILGVTTTDEEGAYGFMAVPEDDYTLIASGYSPVTSIVNVTGGQDTAHDVLLGDTDEWAPVQPPTLETDSAIGSAIR